MLKARGFLGPLVAWALLAVSNGPASATVLDVADAGSGQINVNQALLSATITPTDVTLNFDSVTPPGSGSVTFNAPTASLTINVINADPNTLSVLSLPAAFIAPIFDINTGGGADTININTLLQGAGIYTIDADGGFDILDVSGLGLPLVDTGSSILFNGNPVISYSGIDSVIGAVAAVPEPVSLALFGLGLAGIGVASRRRALLG